jgi:hypothetical protein
MKLPSRFALAMQPVEEIPKIGQISHGRRQTGSACARLSHAMKAVVSTEITIANPEVQPTTNIRCD